VRNGICESEKGIHYVWDMEIVVGLILLMLLVGFGVFIMPDVARKYLYLAVASPYSGRNAGFVRISGVFKGNPSHSIGAGIKAVYAKLKIEGIYKAEVQTTDKDGNIKYEIRKETEFIASHEWAPEQLYFMTDLKDFKFDDWSVVYGTPMRSMDMSDHVVFFEDNQIRIRLALGEEPFEYVFTPSREYEEIRATLRYVPANVPYTLFCTIRDDKILSCERVYEGEMDAVMKKMKWLRIAQLVVVWLIILFMFCWLVFSLFLLGEDEGDWDDGD